MQTAVTASIMRSWDFTYPPPAWYTRRDTRRAAAPRAPRSIFPRILSYSLAMSSVEMPVTIQTAPSTPMPLTQEKELPIRSGIKVSFILSQISGAAASIFS